MSESHERRDHTAMLNLCCGICGIKRKSHQIRKITDQILTKIKSTPGYKDYNLNDPKYPKVICNQHYFAINERIAGKPEK